MNFTYLNANVYQPISSSCQTVLTGLVRVVNDDILKVYVYITTTWWAIIFFSFHKENRIRFSTYQTIYHNKLFSISILNGHRRILITQTKCSLVILGNCHVIYSVTYLR